MAGGPGEPRTAEHPGLGLREAGADASEGLACGAAAETETVQSIRQRLGAAAAGGAGSYASRMRDMTASSRSPKTARTAGVSSAAWGGAATTAEKVAAAALQRAEEERELRALGIEEDEEESASEDEDRHVVGAVAHQSSGASRPISSPRAEHIASGGALDDDEEDTVPVLAAAPVRRWRETAGARRRGCRCAQPRLDAGGARVQPQRQPGGLPSVGGLEPSHVLEPSQPWLRPPARPARNRVLCLQAGAPLAPRGRGVPLHRGRQLLYGPPKLLPRRGPHAQHRGRAVTSRVFRLRGGALPK